MSELKERETPPLMECGHVAQGTNAAGEPSCIICVGLVDGAEKVANPVPLEGRMARCTCEREPVPSSFDLAFFEYRGPGSYQGRVTCRNCRYYDTAHEMKVRENPPHLRRFCCDNFEPIGEREFDLYYCGHAGWD